MVSSPALWLTLAFCAAFASAAASNNHLAQAVPLFGGYLHVTGSNDSPGSYACEAGEPALGSLAGSAFEVICVICDIDWNFGVHERYMFVCSLAFLLPSRLFQRLKAEVRVLFSPSVDKPVCLDTKSQTGAETPKMVLDVSSSRIMVADIVHARGISTKGPAREAVLEKALSQSVEAMLCALAQTRDSGLNFSSAFVDQMVR